MWLDGHFCRRKLACLIVCQTRQVQLYVCCTLIIPRARFNTFSTVSGVLVQAIATVTVSITQQLRSYTVSRLLPTAKFPNSAVSADNGQNYKEKTNLISPIKHTQNIYSFAGGKLFHGAAIDLPKDQTCIFVPARSIW